ncbi:MAG: hypothetical protein LUB59_04355 [Candidatus Gastranaerophilales bacterium]|nr:hypothetical protein [Candidatus Gastranaerophilales bacterium]
MERKEYMPRPYLTCLLYLLVSKSPLEFDSINYYGDSSDIKGFIGMMLCAYPFLIKDKNNCLILTSNRYNKAKKWACEYCKALVSDRVYNKDCNLSSWSALSNEFYNSIRKNMNLKEYKIYSDEYIPVILNEYIQDKIKVRDIKLEFYNPDNIEGSLRIFEYDSATDCNILQEDCFKCKITLDLTEYMRYYNAEKIFNDKRFTSNQQELLIKINEHIDKNEKRIDSQIIIDIYDIQGDNIEVSHKVSENVRKLNKKYEQVFHHKILGKKEYKIYYPILK